MAVIISSKYAHILNEDNVEEYIKNNCTVVSVIDRTKLKDYSEGMILKDKRNSKFKIEFVGNLKIDLANIKTGRDKQVSIMDIVKKYEIVKN